MIDIGEKKSQILSYLKQAGPSLPVRLAKAAKVEPVLASAILSELFADKKVKMSNMKVGTSSLYLIEGQENMLENFVSGLGSGQRNAFERLKKNKILKDNDEEPAIRVALRSLRDFAVPFKFEGQIMWRYAFTPREEIQKILSGEKVIEKEEDEKEGNKEEEKDLEKEEEVEKKLEERSKAEEEVEVEEKQKGEVVDDSSKLKEVEKQKTFENVFEEEEVEKPEFFGEVRDFLEDKKIEFLEEIQTEKKEVVCKVRISSDLGNIDFLLVAKNKKTVSKEEVNACIQRATYSKMPCLIIIRKQPTKTIKRFIEENNLVKIEVMK